VTAALPGLKTWVAFEPGPTSASPTASSRASSPRR